MKNALIIEGPELAGLLTESVARHLKKNGYNPSGMKFLLTATALVVTGISKVDEEDDDCDEYEDEDEDCENDSSTSELAVSVYNEIVERPCTINTIAERLSTSATSVQRALNHLDERVARVCATRENGQTVPMFMAAGTNTFASFVENERTRVAARAEECKELVLRNVPKFYEPAQERLEIVEKICASLPTEELAESFRCDNRAIFYTLADQGVLHHAHGAWRAFRTETDEKNVDMLRRSVEEITPNHETMALEDIANALPGEVNLGFLAHVLQR